MPSPRTKILVIDDAAESSTAVSALCSQYYAITYVGSTKEALQLLPKDQFALVVINLALPDADGLAVAAQIRESRAFGVAILFLSAGDCNDEALRKGYHLGRIDFIQKPASSEALNAKVKCFAALYHQEQEIVKKSQQLAAAKLKLAEANLKLIRRSDQLAELQSEQEQTGQAMDLLNEEMSDSKKSALLTQQARRLFLTELSHEIRTPMTSILGMIDFTLSSDLKPDQANQLQIAKNAGKVLVKVLNDLFSAGQPAAAPQAPVGAALQVAAQPSGKKTGLEQELTVLIAEDDPIIMGLMAMLMVKAGHQVLAATDGHEAIRIWESKRPSLVLMDVQMPHLDGLEATRRIRSREKEIGGQVPIYGLTALVMEEDINNCLGAGMTGHIGKPIDFPSILEVVKRHQSYQTPE